MLHVGLIRSDAQGGAMHVAFYMLHVAWVSPRRTPIAWSRWYAAEGNQYGERKEGRERAADLVRLAPLDLPRQRLAQQREGVLDVVALGAQRGHLALGAARVLEEALEDCVRARLWQAEGGRHAGRSSWWRLEPSPLGWRPAPK